MHKNPILANIYKEVVAPSMNRLAKTRKGKVIVVYEEEKKVDVQYFEGAQERLLKKIPFPKDGDGVYKETLKVGEFVEVSFRNGSKQEPYISFCYGGDKTDDFNKGKDLPKSFHLF